MRLKVILFITDVLNNYFLEIVIAILILLKLFT